MARIVKAEEHDALGIYGDNQLANVSPFESAPQLGRVLWAQEDHDQLGVLSVESRKIGVQVQSRELRIMEVFVKDAALAEC